MSMVMGWLKLGVLANIRASDVSPWVLEKLMGLLRGVY